MGFAAALAVIGPRARRAARAGLVAYAASSAITDGPVKWASQRDRPRRVLLADLPRRGRRPRTSSLPSSYTANAAAFTVAAAIELPTAAPLLATATSLVALQHMQAVRHYPTDVIAGLLTGAAIGTATTVALCRVLDQEGNGLALGSISAHQEAEQDRNQDKQHGIAAKDGHSVGHDGAPHAGSTGAGSRSAADPAITMPSSSTLRTRPHGTNFES